MLEARVSELPTLTREEWHARGRALFGDDVLQWRFVCPSCGHVAPVSAWRDAGAHENTVAFSCVGRWIEGTADDRTFRNAGGPCTYAGGGLIGLNPVRVIENGKVHAMFAFAPEAAAAKEIPVKRLKSVKKKMKVRVTKKAAKPAPAPDPGLHCDDYIDDPTADEALRKFLTFARSPGHGLALPKPHPRLFADYEGKRVRVTMASRFGHVGVTAHLDHALGYETCARVHQLSNFSSAPPEAARDAVPK